MGTLSASTLDAKQKQMNLFRSRVHHLIECLSDEELEIIWLTLEALYCDLYALRAVQEGVRSRNPGDTLTLEEALDLLPVLQPNQRLHKELL